MTLIDLKYYVLKPKGSDPYAAASRAAMRQFAVSIEPVNPKLAEELFRWAAQEADEAY